MVFWAQLSVIVGRHEWAEIQMVRDEWQPTLGTYPVLSPDVVANIELVSINFEYILRKLYSVHVVYFYERLVLPVLQFKFLGSTEYFCFFLGSASMAML